MPDAPVTKRPRTDTDSSTGAIPIRSKIWMPYGDIILQAESTLFRINRDVLAQNSPIFRDMFTVPQPPNEPAIDGCPVVQVSDSAKDWELLLNELYHPFRYGDALSVETLAAMLRLGRKYEMKAVRDSARWRIHQEFPTDLEDWDDLDRRRLKVKGRDEHGVLIHLLNVVYECGVRKSIPALAFTCLDVIPFESIMNDKVLRADGSVSTLDTNIKLALAVAADSLLKHSRSLFSWLEDGSVIPSVICETRNKCIEQRQKLYSAFIWGDDRSRYNNLAAWDRRAFAISGLCSACEDAGRDLVNGERWMSWESLPGFFALPNWEDLKDEE